MTGLFKALTVALALFAACLAAPARADTLFLSGVVQDLDGRPLPRLSVRVVLGSDPAPRRPGAGRMIVTDAQGRFTVQSDVSLTSRRIRLDNPFVRHPSQLLEIGFEMDLLGQPALHWTELDFIDGQGPLRGMSSFVAGKDGAFDVPLDFHASEHAWSIPGDPRGFRLSDVGTDVRVETWDDGTPGRLELGLVVVHQRFEIR
ncbi:carboxypeptidase-like regulatory domain-containing protein [Anianabacter salinae]|uniref:carboxypeptidase-like regulatory domain-containing protein n=1 Tax=Anianabacter salinae TaxID=2851023 RepID=UPI00225E1B21|nr:carboxypeptidase-like regulatory domain-containing protein [Anianabacter salinae]MBV0912042.1 carboxypeptidase-like regulatory domain-containing protein [Anianabacter salinae]